MTNEKKVYVVYNGNGMEVFTTMKDAIEYASLGEDVYNNQWEEEIISMTSIRRDLRNWVQVSAYDRMGNHFTITPTVLHKRGSIHPYLPRGVA